MAGYYERPSGFHASFTDRIPDTVHVYRLSVASRDSDYDRLPAPEIPGYRLTLNDDGRPQHRWDDDVAPPAVVRADSPPFDEVAHVVGFWDEQDMYDPYSHLGVSNLETAVKATRDVLGRLPHSPLWELRVAPVQTHRSFEAGRVFSLTPPTSVGTP